MIDKYFSKEINRIIFFTLIILLISYFANYFEILFYRPQSIHFIRQTDSLSFAKNYFQNGMHFFSPQTFNLTTTNGNAACEFPILYYITAIFYFIFGEHEFILKTLNIIIVFTGFYYTTKLNFLLLNDWILSFLITFLVLSSGVILYYTNNFLPDSSSLGFSFIGLYHFIKYTKLNANKSLIFSFIFLTIAGLLKATYMIFPLAILSIFIIEKIGINISKRRIFTNYKLLLILFIISISLVFSWYYYAISYNKINGGNYFLTHTAPIWELSKKRIFIILDLISNYWANDYFYPSTLHTIYILILVSLIFIKKSNKFLVIFSLLLLLGSLSYLILFFEKFQDHDYYGLLFIPIILFLLLNSFSIIKKYINNKWVKITIYFSFIILNILSLNYAIYRANKRYKGKINDNYIFQKFSDIKPKLDSLNIGNNKTFIVIGDYTRNGSLYFINKQGWTIKDTSPISIKALKLAYKNKPDYLITTEDFYIENKLIGNLNKELIYRKNGMNFYKLNK